MKLVTLKEAKYGTGLSQKEREQLVHEIYNLIPKADNTRFTPQIYSDDWRAVIIFDNVDYYDVLEKMDEKFGEHSFGDGYEGGTFKRNIPNWKVKDHQIEYATGYGDVNITISKI